MSCQWLGAGTEIAKPPQVDVFPVYPELVATIVMAGQYLRCSRPSGLKVPAKVADVGVDQCTGGVRFAVVPDLVDERLGG
ncbi:MAG TPA: hypothetical protein VKV02_12640, partial [Acidobacteriaceae bacterium]|nr:hypothetical protein [Acidobacteriaceae bacterium]